MRGTTLTRGAYVSPRVQVTALLLAAIAWSAVGCSGGGSGGSSGGGSSATPPAPPTNVRALAVAGAPDDVQVEWTPPAGPVDGYLVELKIGAGSFQAQNDLSSLLPGDWDGLRVTLAAGAPDLVDYVVRMRAVRGGAASAYSNEGVYHHPLNAPRNVVARFDWSQGAPAVQWDRSSTATTGVSLQRQEVDAYTAPLGAWIDLPVADPAAVTFVDTSAALDHRYRYQVANVAGAVMSARAASGAVLAGLAPPTLLGLRFDKTLDAVVATTSSVNPDADGMRLERELLDASRTPIGPWETIAVPPGVSTTLLDATWPELSKLQYRVTNLHGTYASTPATFSSAIDTPLYHPADLVASAAEGGAIDLSWRNRSALAREIEVRWSSPNGTHILATLAPTATTYRVTTLGLGYYRFWIRAQLSWNTAGAAETSVDFTTPNPPGALSLASADLAANDATDAVLLPGGSWAFLTKPTTSTTLSVSATGDPWPAVQRTDAVATNYAGYAPALLADAQGRPHVVYLATAGDGGDPILTHLWWDGTGWTSEPMVRGAFASGSDTPTFQAVLDATGTPQAMVSLRTGTSTFTAVYVRKDAGAWTSEVVPVPAYEPYSRLVAFGLDAVGNPHFTYAKTEWARDGAGTWHTSTMTPISGTYYEPHNPYQAAWLGADDAVVLVFGLGSTTDDYEVGVVEKVAGVWQPLRLLAIDDRTYGVFPPFELQARPDGSRVVVLYGTEVGVRAYERSAGTWNATLVAPPQSLFPQGFAWGFLRAGFDADGDVHLLVRKAGAGAGYLDAYEP